MPQGIQLEVLLIAAGPTAWDQQHRLGGQVDLPLAESGLASAKKRASEVSAPKLILCGPDEASRQTATAFTSAFGKKPKIVNELAEMRLGLWEGLRRDELLERCPKACRGWESDGAAIVPPGGETWTQVHDRTIPTIAAAIAKAKGPIAIVARPIVLSVVRAWLDARAGRPEDHQCAECADVFNRVDQRIVDPAAANGSSHAVGQIAAGIIGAAIGIGGLGFIGSGFGAGGMKS